MSSLQVMVAEGHEYYCTSMKCNKNNMCMQMGDLTILPDGRIFLCNGAQFGTSQSSHAHLNSLHVHPALQLSVLRMQCYKIQLLHTALVPV